MWKVAYYSITIKYSTTITITIDKERLKTINAPHKKGPFRYF